VPMLNALRVTCITVAVAVGLAGGCREVNVNETRPLNGPVFDIGDVTDLAEVERFDHSVTLSFTEVDDGTGAPANYDVRLASPEIDWGSADHVTEGACSFILYGVQIGQTRYCTVEGLTPGTQYQFQMVSFHGTGPGGPFGALSNIVTITTTNNNSNPT